MLRFMHISFVSTLLAFYFSALPVQVVVADHEHDHHDHEHSASEPLYQKLEETLLTKIGRDDGHHFSRVRPNETTLVKVNMYIRDAHMKTTLSKVSYDLYNPWSVDLIIRQAWTDRRLAYDETSLKDAHQNFIVLTNPKSIWVPDTFFPTAEKGDFHYTITPNMFVWVYPNGDVLHSNRISLTLPCRQKSLPRRFGHGIGVPVACPVRIASYGYPDTQVHYEWDGENPIDVNEDLYIQNNGNYCVLDKVTHNETYVANTRAGPFSSLPAEFQFLC